uniref:hypothetical protein n=1 Tax=uncultured Sphingomonas sp. TaxID=158754 RepID=UPI0035CB2DAA
MSVAEAAARSKPLPTIERPKPICNDVFRAFDDIVCSAERLKALFAATTQNLSEAVEGMPDGSSTKRLYEIWMIFLLGIEKFTELEADIGAAQDAFIAVRHGRRREVAA